MSKGQAQMGGVMRALSVLLGMIAVVAMVLAAGCGSPATSADTQPSATPDAVVTAEPEPSSSMTVTTDESGDAEVVIEKAGFAYEGEYDEVGYGLVLKNTSALDAVGVQVSVNFMNKGGTILTTEDSTINVIPAGETYYLGGQTYTEDGKPKKMEAFVDIDSSEPAQYALPDVSQVRIIRDDWGDISVKGQVKNDLDDALSSIASITCVIFDKSGKVVGGGFTFLDSDLKSGRTAGFEVVNGPSVTQSSKAASAKASMDNQVAY